MGDTDCQPCQNRIFDAISTKLSTKIFLGIVVLFFLSVSGVLAYTYSATNKLDQRDWRMMEKMEDQVTQKDFDEFKREIKEDLRMIQSSINELKD
jgi:hypothetical protein